MDGPRTHSQQLQSDLADEQNASEARCPDENGERPPDQCDVCGFFSDEVAEDVLEPGTRVCLTCVEGGHGSHG
jgi:hypothetical protein